jgi:hypothetical protein
MQVFLTGIRDGEFITSSSTGTQNKGSIIQIKGFYPPSLQAVSNVDPILLRDAFNRLDFFANMTLEQRSKWLIDNAINNNDLYLEDVNIGLKFIKIGGSFFTKALTPYQLNILLRGNPNDPEGYWSIREVYNMFPRKSGSKAKRHTLIFRPGNWSLMFNDNAATSFDGMYVDLDTLTLNNGHLNKPSGGYLRVFKVERLQALTPAFAVTHSQIRNSPLTWDTVLRLSILTSGNEEVKEEMNKIKLLVDWFPPAMFKSLIQKLIRTRCQQVEYSGAIYRSQTVLLTAFGMLMLHAGAFVPTIQRFVTGMESATKRLAVSICEDAYLEDGRYLLSMYAAAAIAQQDRTWQPSDELIVIWMKAALLAQQDRRLFDYDWRNRTNDMQCITEWTPLVFSYLLLAEIKSFESDIQMVGSIAERRGIARQYIAINEELKVMPLIHCLDQHTFTEIALYMSIPPLTSNESVFKTIFGNIWDKVVGVNPRNVKYENWKADDPDVLEIRNAQKQVWISKIYEPRDISTGRDITENKYNFTYTLDESWLAGLIGPIEVRVGHTTSIVVVRCDDIYNFTAIKRPSRDTKSATELTEEEKSIAINGIKLALTNGHSLKHVPDTLPSLKNSTVYLVNLSSVDDKLTDEGEVYVLKLSNGNVVRWSDLINMSFEFPIYPKITPSIDYALLHTGDGIMEGADEIYDYLLKNTGRNILNRLSTYLEGNKSDITLFKISRDGSGQDYAVVPEDISVNVLLCYLCCLYPAALMKTSSGFKVKCGPLMWSLREKLQLSLNRVLTNSVPWAIPVPDGRKLWEHQRSILESMKQKHLNNRKGHEIWASVGSGKTLCLLLYIDYLIRKGDMPQYCVYTLPPSAMKSIVRELEMMKIPYQIMDMRANSVNQTILPAMVNLVHHDHMRQGGLDIQMKNLASEMFFIVDEFHKTMNKTIRTSIALEIVRLSAEFVAMTGTLIKDDNPLDLIQWLAQVVQFEVTEHNYFTALSALISKKVLTNIVVERVLIDAPLIDEKHYYTLVPKSLGGTSDTLHFREALSECYKSITVRMIQEAMTYLRLGEKLFMVAKDANHQIELQQLLQQQGVQNIFLITSNTSIVLTPADNSPIMVVITTMRQVEGYTLTDRRIAIYCVCLSNQCARDQCDGRLNRIGQPSPAIRIITVHAGILSYIMRNYETARNLAEAIRGFAEDIHLEDIKQVSQLM